MATKRSTAERAAVLREQLAQANHDYHVLDAPTISDAEYDEMLRELGEIEHAHPDLLVPDSPTQRVGGAPSADFAPYRHVVPMLSLGNVFDAAGLRTFDARVARLAGGSVSYVCELKIDGLAMSLRYEGGTFRSAGTRGDGSVGEDVTPNVRTIAEIPRRLAGKDAPQTLDVLVGVQARPLRGALGFDQAPRLVHPQRLRVHRRQLGRDRDHEHAAIGRDLNPSAGDAHALRGHQAASCAVPAVPAGANSFARGSPFMTSESLSTASVCSGDSEAGTSITNR